MKNVHVLPTDKPSRLIIYSTLLNEFRLLDEPIEDWKHKRNIYITSDEEIKDRDWFLNTLNNKLDKCDDLIYEKNVNLSNWCKKIILTTDQDLIKDGVQAIDNEFLEWFVKNPKSEEVEVDKEKATLGEVSGTTYIDYKYKIIIPKEEAKQDLEKEMFELEQELNIPSHLRWHNSKHKQETLEEFAKQEAIKQYSEDTFGNLIVRKSIEKGAKWQQERMYSEMDIVLILSKFRDMKMIAFSEWFEQFKNK